jgi:hypothetical protein
MIYKIRSLAEKIFLFLLKVVQASSFQF